MRKREGERDEHLVMCFVFEQSRDWRDWRGLREREREVLGMMNMMIRHGVVDEILSIY